MINKITKNLIIVGAIVFSFVFINTTFAYSCVGYYCGNYDYTPIRGANQGYSQNPSQVNPQNDYYLYGSDSNNQPVQSNQTGVPVVNNYYMQNAPVTPTPASTVKTTTAADPVKKVATSTSTSTTKNTTTSNTSTNNTNGTNSSDGNGLGASAYNGSNGITALSFKGSGGFMPSSIWQWFLVVVLILIIIILARILSRKPAAQVTH